MSSFPDHYLKQHRRKSIYELVTLRENCHPKSPEWIAVVALLEMKAQRNLLVTRVIAWLALGVSAVALAKGWS